MSWTPELWRKASRAPWPVLLLTLGIYCQLFVSQPLQLMGLFATALAALAAVATGRAAPTPLTHFDAVVLFCAQLSLGVAAFQNDFYSCQYSALFLVSYIFIAVLTRSMTLEDIISAYAGAMILVIATLLATSSAALFRALDVHAEDRWLLRFSPLGIHPNLLGLVCGGGAVAFVFKSAMARSVAGRAAYVALAAVSVVIVVATSARASLVGLIGGALVVGAIALRMTSARIIVTASIVSALAAATLSGPLLSYLDVILELNSETRGVDSGASGRTTLWKKGFDLFTSDINHFLFGSGFRSTSQEAIGFSVESSYITILLESGLVFGGALIISILVIALRRVRHTLRCGPRDFPASGAVTMFMLFVLIQSIFNRYIFGIGNPLSLIFLVVCGKLALLDAKPARPLAFRGGRARASI